MGARRCACSAFPLILGLLLLEAAETTCLAQRHLEPNSAPALAPEAAIKAGRVLVADLLAQQPDRDSTNVGVLTIRSRDGRRRSLPVRVRALVAPTNWVNIYEAWPNSNDSGVVTLTIVHTPSQPNQYRLVDPNSTRETDAHPQRLLGNDTMIPFAGSDFWVCDLGLEFLHWPEQRVIKQEMRRSQPCDVLESTNPNPAAGSYARVLCWLQHESPHGIVQAEAYNSRNELLKDFEPKTLEKVHGQYEPEKLEIRNRQTRSLSFIEYDLKH